MIVALAQAPTEARGWPPGPCDPDYAAKRLDELWAANSIAALFPKHVTKET
jgi:hypothetical protein